MDTTPEQFQASIDLFLADFIKDFPEENALLCAANYCHFMLESRKNRKLEKAFSFWSISDLKEVLRMINEQEKKTGAKGKETEGSNPPAKVQPRSAVALRGK